MGEVSRSGGGGGQAANGKDDRPEGRRAGKKARVGEVAGQGGRQWHPRDANSSRRQGASFDGGGGAISFSPFHHLRWSPSPRFAGEDLNVERCDFRGSSPIHGGGVAKRRRGRPSR